MEQAELTQIEAQQRLDECLRLYAELRSLIRLVRTKERSLMAALGRLGRSAPAAADLPGLEWVAGWPNGEGGSLGGGTPDRRQA
jgi:hypothetical protein